MKTNNLLFIIPVVMLSLVMCSQKKNTGEGELAFASDNGSITLPPGFKAVVVADNLGNARHLAVRDNGDIYVKLGGAVNGSAQVALRDKDGDGVADVITYFGSNDAGTGIRIHNGYLYYSSRTAVYRRKFNGNELVPGGAAENMVSFKPQPGHEAKSFDFDGIGNMYVAIGAPSNACQSSGRTPGVAGQDPCPLLDEHGGIWKFDEDITGQKLDDGFRYATGIRHAVGMTWNDQNNVLYAMQHGRDQLHQLWPLLYTEQQSAELPAEELLEIQEGDNFGWPYCYYNHIQSKKVLAPEYGGDGTIIGRCSQYEDPVIAFPGHWAPNDITFYQSASFPSKYRNGAFIAFHGSWNRAPYPQQGYKVVFVPFKNGKPAGNYEAFADQFAGDGESISGPGSAEHRPCGVAVGPDGSLYICDSVDGRIWRVVYTG